MAQQPASEPNSSHGTGDRSDWRENVRVEDEALLRGSGRFIDDMPLRSGTLHAAILRAPVAHATIHSIEISRALALPGVATVITGEDIKKYTRPFVVGVKQKMDHWSLAVDRVRFVGEPVAVVCADTPYVAEDALTLIDVHYVRLDPIVDPEAAISSDAPYLHPSVGSNVVSDRSFRYGDPERAFAEAAHEVRIKIRYPRNSVTPIECFGVIAVYSDADGAYDVTTHFQGPYAIHPVMALALQVPGTKLRIKTPPDSGGSFGTKHAVFTYVVALAVAARITGRPVKWIEDRLEHLSGATSATNRVTTLRAAVSGDGVITALDYDQLDDCGGYLRAPEPATLYRMHGNLTGAYRIANLAVRNRIVLTNKTPSGLVRGFGGPQVYIALERLTEKISRTLNIPHREIMQRNLVQAGDFPYQTASGAILDSGDYPAAFALADKKGIPDDLIKRRDAARENGKLYGIGYAAIVEPSISNMGYITTVLTAEERDKAGPKGGAVATASVQLDPLGSVSVHVASVPQGQGHQTVLTQVVATALGIKPKDVRAIVELDTGRDAWSIASGNYSSRFAGAVAGTAHIAATRLRERLARLAATQLNCDPEDIIFSDGQVFRNNEPEKAVAFRRLAAISHWAQGSLPQGVEPVIRETAFWSPDSLKPPNELDEINSSAAYGFVLDMCGIEINPATGQAKIDRYVTIHDAGRLLNHELANGQIRGGFANAVGAAMYEQFAYGSDGSFLTGTFADYPVPTATEIPDIEILHLETPSPVTPLGAKGIGEGNCMSTPVCLANAFADALQVEHIELPMTPAKIIDLLDESEPRALQKPAIQHSDSDLSLQRNGFALNGTGTCHVNASPEEVWSILLDPDHLAAVIPGCRTLIQDAENAYSGDIVMGAGIIKGLFHAEVALHDLVRPHSLRLKGGARGKLGTSEGEAAVRLATDGDGTRIEYTYGVDLSGKVAAVGSRMLDGAARMIIGEFFRRLTKRAEPEGGAKTTVNTGNVLGQLKRFFGASK